MINNFASKRRLVTAQYYPALDGVRAVAVIVVMWFHASLLGYDYSGSQNAHGLSSMYYTLSVLGQTGVDMFFILSGFLITGILMDTARDKHVFRNFYIRRVLRIFPLYFAVLFSTFLFYDVMRAGNGVDSRIFYYIVYVQNWLAAGQDFEALGHTWTLAIEEQFYVIWPLLFITLYKRSIKVAVLVCILLILISWIGRYHFLWLFLNKLSVTNTISRMDGLVMGALLSILCKHYKDQLYFFVMNSRVFIIVATTSVLLLFVVLCNGMGFLLITHHLIMWAL